jgi:PAS domain-containing protein
LKYECSSETKILELIPDGILAVDRDLAVVCINPAACRLLGVPEAAEPVGRPVGRIMDDAAFLRLRDGDEAQLCDQCAAPEGNLRLERAFVRDAESSLLLCRMHAVGQEREAVLSDRMKAAEQADAICRRQLQIVQEIAGLLGESAVETQSALEELKRTLLPDRTKQHG